MPSSKLNPQATKKTQIAWCKAPPDPPYVIFPPGAPPKLAAYAAWVDHDPLHYSHVSESFTLNAITAGDHYSGSSQGPAPTLEIVATRTPGTDLWDILLTIYFAEGGSEDFTWNAVPADPAIPLKLIPPMEVTIPGEDYRDVALYG